MSGTVVVAIIKNRGILVAHGPEATQALLQRIAGSLASGEALAVSITAGAAGSAQIAEFGLTGADAMQFVREFLASDVPGSQKTLYSILAGIAIGGAAAGAGVTGASAVAFGARLQASHTNQFGSMPMTNLVKLIGISGSIRFIRLLEP